MQLRIWEASESSSLPTIAATIEKMQATCWRQTMKPYSIMWYSVELTLQEARHRTLNLSSFRQKRYKREVGLQWCSYRTELSVCWIHLAARNGLTQLNCQSKETPEKKAAKSRFKLDQVLPRLQVIEKTASEVLMWQMGLYISTAPQAFNCTMVASILIKYQKEKASRRSLSQV